MLSLRRPQGFCRARGSPRVCWRAGAVHAHEAVVGAMTVTETRTVASLTAANINDFLVEHRGELMVVDYHTKLCGPCKFMAPVFEEMAQEFTDVAFGSFDCSSDPSSRKLAMKAGVRALPTFHLYCHTPDGATLVLAELTGAKATELRSLVMQHRSLN